MKKLNLRNFDVSKLLTESDYQVLLSARRLFVTQARFTGNEAVEAMGQAPAGTYYADEERTYGGMLIADDPEDALRQAELRGFGEEVCGVLVDQVPTGKIEIPISAN